MQEQFEREMGAAGRRADVDISVANQRSNALELENSLLRAKLQQNEDELKKAQKQLRISSIQLRRAAARERQLRQQPSVGENLKSKSVIKPIPLRQSRRRRIKEA